MLEDAGIVSGKWHDADYPTSSHLPISIRVEFGITLNEY